MKRKVTKFLVEITMRDLTNPEFLFDVLDAGGDTMVHDFKIIKEKTVIADVADWGEKCTVQWQK